MHPKLLLFGATGAIGGEISRRFTDAGWAVIAITRSPGHADAVVWNPLDANDNGSHVMTQGPFDAICWAQGQNCNDSIDSFDLELHRQLYDSNVGYILQSLAQVRRANVLKSGAKLVVISSIWQEIARQNKLSYTVTKAALKGLIHSLAADLAADGILVNAVLPGVLDTPMTRSNLGPDQVSTVESATLFNRLPTLYDVSGAVLALCGPTNSGITGQFIQVDLGYSNVRII